MLEIAGGIILALLFLRFWPVLLIAALGIAALVVIATFWEQILPFMITVGLLAMVTIARDVITERRTKLTSYRHDLNRDRTIIVRE